MTGYLTLKEILQSEYSAGNGKDIISEAVQRVPELNVLPVDTIQETHVETTVCVDPGIAYFRESNEGIDYQKGEYVPLTFPLTYFDRRMAIDKKDWDKPSPGIARLIRRELVNAIIAWRKLITPQFWYGLANNPKGAPGIVNQMLLDAEHIKLAGGTTALSSVFAVKFGVDDGVCLLFGNGTTLDMGSDEWMKETVTASNSKFHYAYTNSIDGYVGQKVENRHRVMRLANIDAGSNTLEDATMQDLLDLWYEKNDEDPDAFFMTRRSQRQLWNSRVTTEIVKPPAVLEYECNNGLVPIIVTPNLSNAETVVSL